MSHNWTDQRPFVIDKSDLESFIAVHNLKVLTCGFCMKSLREGQTARWVYVPNASNTFVCADCDSADAATRFGRRWRDTIGPILRRWGSS